jgi:hypothetical protein
MLCIVRSSFTFQGVSYRPGQPIELSDANAARMIAAKMVTAKPADTSEPPAKQKAKEPAATIATQEPTPEEKPAAAIKKPGRPRKPRKPKEAE